MCAAWRCGGLVFRLRCRMVFLPAAFSAVSAPFLAAGLFRPCFRLFRPLCCVLSLRADAVAAYAVLAFLLSDISAEIVAAFFDGILLPLQRTVFRDFPKGYLLHAERPPFRKWLFGASGIASRQPSGQGRAVPRQGHPEGIIRGVRRSEILLLFIVRNIKFYLKVNLCPDFVSYYLSVGSNVFA